MTSNINTTLLKNGDVIGLKLNNSIVNRVNQLDTILDTKADKTEIDRLDLKVNTFNTGLDITRNYLSEGDAIRAGVQSGTYYRTGREVRVVVNTLPQSVYGIPWNNATCNFVIGADVAADECYHRWDALGLSLGRQCSVGLRMDLFPMSSLTASPTAPFRLIALSRGFFPKAGDIYWEVHTGKNTVGKGTPYAGYDSAGPNNIVNSSVATYTNTAWNSVQSFCRLMFIQMDRGTDGKITIRLRNSSGSLLSTWVSVNPVSYTSTSFLFGMFCQNNSTVLHKGVLLDLRPTPSITYNDWLAYWDTERYIL